MPRARNHYPSTWLAPVLISLIILITGCGTGGKTIRIPDRKESIQKEDPKDNGKITEGIFFVNDWIDGRKTILFVHGIGEQKWLGGIAEEFGPTHNILEYKYSIYEDFGDNANKLLNEIIKISTKCEVMVVGYSFGANILWQSTVNAEALEQQALRNVDTRLIAPMFGSKYARGHTNAFFASIYSALPFTPKVSNLLNALDPEGPIAKSLIRSYNVLVSRVRSTEMFIAMGDSLNPNEEVLNILPLLKFYWSED